tara:strand:- start:1087 stop:1449 length:363 start_codon:yes stop_codon:yes gene_type:complete
MNKILPIILVVVFSVYSTKTMAIDLKCKILKPAAEHWPETINVTLRGNSKFIINRTKLEDVEMDGHDYAKGYKYYKKHYVEYEFFYGSGNRLYASVYTKNDSWFGNDEHRYTDGYSCKLK